MHNIKGMVSDGEFKVEGRSNGPIPSLTNALRNVGVTWVRGHKEHIIKKDRHVKPPHSSSALPTSQSRVSCVSTLRGSYKALIATPSAVGIVRGPTFVPLFLLETFPMTND